MHRNDSAASPTLAPSSALAPRRRPPATAPVAPERRPASALPPHLLNARGINDNARAPIPNALHLASRWDAAVDGIGPAQRPNRTAAKRALDHCTVAAGAYRSWGLAWGPQRDALAAAMESLATELVTWSRCAEGTAYDAGIMRHIILAACEASAACHEALVTLDAARLEEPKAKPVLAKPRVSRTRR